MDEDVPETKRREKRRKKPKGETPRPCASCGNDGPLAMCQFRENVGLVFMRLRADRPGPLGTPAPLCGACVDRAFWRAHAISMIFGWWGLLSVFSTLAHLPLNVLGYFNARAELAHAPMRFGAWLLWPAALTALLVLLGSTVGWLLAGIAFALLVALPLALALAPRAFVASAKPRVGPARE